MGKRATTGTFLQRSSRSWRLWCLALCGVLLCGSLACNRFVRGGQQDDAGVVTPVAENTDTLTPGVCKEGDARCVESVLQVCSSPNMWKRRQVCSNAGLCDVDGCVRPVCEPGDLRCDPDTAQLQGCNSEQSGWEFLAQCDSLAECNTKEQSCTGPCTEGSYQCSGADLQRCDGPDVGWKAVAECVTSALCDEENERCQPPVCLGETRCQGATLLQCTSGRDTFAAVDVCKSAALCDDELGCLEPICEAEQYRCLDAELQSCNADGTGWDTVDTCLGGAYCSVRGQTCTEAPCRSGQLECNEATLRRCSDERTQWDTYDECTSSALCDDTVGAESCRNPVCPFAGAQRCVGAQMQVCATGQDAWLELDICESEALCALGVAQQSRKCPAPLCQPGEFLCAEGGTLVQACSAGLTEFETIETCSANQCDAVAGVCAPCQPGTWSCNQARLQRCDELAGWVFVAQCDTAQLCDAAGTQSCIPPVCSAGATECQAGDLVRCNAGRTAWEVIDNCGVGETCDAIGGQCDVCDPGATRCEGDVRVVCDADGQVESRQMCGQGRCSAAGCVKCDAGAFSCDAAGQLRQCQADGVGFVVVADCGFSGKCDASVQRCCMPGESLGCRATGEVARSCSGDGLSESVQLCNVGSADLCVAGKCVGCDNSVRSVRCNAAATYLQVCDSQLGVWNDNQHCAHGCIAPDGNDGYCAPDCRPGSDYRCSPDNRAQQFCNLWGNWDGGTTCQFGCLPDYGECSPECAPGARRCGPSDGAPEQCSPEGLWRKVGSSCEKGCIGGLCVACESNEECTDVGAPRCAGVDGCQACQSGDDCGHLSGMNACLAGRCVSCSSDVHCTGGRRCSVGQGECVECLSAAECKLASKPVCGSAGSCVACGASAACPSGVCDTRSSSATLGQCLGCIKDSDCGGGVCGANGQCFECRGVDEGCSGSDVCSGGGVCVGCLNSEHCPDRDAARCSTTTNECVGCTEDADCHFAQWPTCSGGTCVACESDAECANGNVCDGTETCDASGQCASGTPLSCAAAGVCMTNTCDPLLGCNPKAVPNGTACSDSDSCTSSDMCTNGTCSGVTVNCDDSNPCTTDACNAEGTCTHAPLSSGTCDDGNACTTSDSCVAGACMGATISCDDGNVCTTDVCSPATGCAHTNNSATCDDGNPCTEGDSCAGGSCSGAVVSCTSPDVCQVGSCNAQTGQCEFVLSDAAECQPE